MQKNEPVDAWDGGSHAILVCVSERGKPSERRKPGAEDDNAATPAANGTRRASASSANRSQSVSEGGNWRTRVVNRSLGPAADRAVQRGQALVAAASRLVYKGGADDITMQAVAAEAELSLRVLYQHFASKDDLLVALIEETQLVFERILREHADRYDDPLDRLGAILYFATDVRQHPRSNFIVAMAKHTTRVSMAAPDQLGRARGPVTALITEVVRDVAAAGLIDSQDGEAAGAFVALALISYETNQHLGNSLGAPLPTPEQFVRYCAQSIGAKVEPGWEKRFAPSPEEIERSRELSERLAGGRSRGPGAKARPRSAGRGRSRGKTG